MSSFQLDNTDIGILNLLQIDGLLTHKEIAHKLKKTKSPIGERIKKLREHGYIKSTVALIDPNKLPQLFIAFPHIQLKEYSKGMMQEFRAEMDKHPEILECYQLTGQYDFMIKIAVSDMKAYNQFILENISPLPYVGKLESFMVMMESKRNTAYEIKPSASNNG
jgi:DNA-binding Lrp family transcriptional regulator